MRERRKNRRGRKKEKKSESEESRKVVWEGERVAAALSPSPGYCLADIFSVRPRFWPFSPTEEPDYRLHTLKPMFCKGS